jgi:hypothetical protein
MARIILGIIIGTIGAIIWFYYNAANTACSSAFISALAPGQCNEVTTIHTIGGIAALVGIAMVVWGAMLNRS